MGLATLDAALLTALEALAFTSTPSASQPFAWVGRYAGDLTREGLSDVTQQRFPSCLLRWDGGTDARSVDATEGTEDYEVSTWTVYVALEEPRDVDDAITTASTSFGLLDLVDAATGAISGLTVDGEDASGAAVSATWRDRRVRIASRKTALVERGVAYVVAITVEARITLAQVTPPDDSVPLTLIHGDVDLAVTDPPPTPFVPFESDF